MHIARSINLFCLMFCLIFLGTVRGADAQRGSSGYVPQLHRGQEALRARKWASAASAFREALRWNRNGVEAHTGLGRAYLAIGQTKRAADEFRTALRLNPHAEDAERGLHQATTEGEDEEAFKKLEEQVKSEPENVDILTTYAEELVERGRLDEAELHAEVVLRLNPKEAHAYCVLGRVEAKKGNDAEAVKNLEIAIKLDNSDDDAFVTLGDLAMKAKDYKKAVRYYRRVTSIVPDQTDGHRKLAEALTASGDTKGAEREGQIIQRLEALVPVKK